MKVIPLTQGLIAVVDDEDYDEIIKFKWHAVKQGQGNGTTWYAARNWKKPNGLSSTITMHRQIMGPPPPDKPNIDHINHNTLDNRRSEMRFCTNAENSQNSRYRDTQGKTSIYKGVSLHMGRYHAQICHQRKVTCLAHWATEEAAALAYNKAALRLHGEFSLINKLTTPEDQIIATEQDLAGYRAKWRIAKHLRDQITTQ